MTFTVELTPIEEARLLAGARQRGIAPQDFLKNLVVEHLPSTSDLSFAEILEPVHKYSEEHGESEEDLEAFVDSELASYRAEKRNSIRCHCNPSLYTISP